MFQAHYDDADDHQQDRRRAGDQVFPVHALHVQHDVPRQRHHRDVQGVGIGVDYGIYIYSRMQALLRQGMELRPAYLETLEIAGNAVLFTGVTLATGVATWIFSPLKFQADMGILLTFMFLVNMLGALLLLPALAAWLLPRK